MTKLPAIAARGARTGLAVALTLLAAGAFVVPARADDAGIFNPATLATTDGRQIYERICQGCHMPDARGAAGAGNYPALARDPALASRKFMTLTVLNGRRNMPAFSTKHAIGFFFAPITLTDAQVAAVVNYVRTHFGNRYEDLTTAAEVRALDR